MKIITDKQQVIDEVLNRSQFDLEEVNQKVKEVLENIKKNGDKALFEYTEKFDGVKLEALKVTEEEINEAYASVDKELLEALQEAHDNIKKFHQKQLQKSFIVNEEAGKIVGQVVNPIEKVGIYVPGGTAPSTATSPAIRPSPPRCRKGCRRIPSLAVFNIWFSALSRSFRG